MKRAKRLQPVSALADEAERDCATQVTAIQGRLTEAERRRDDLKRYLSEYQSMYQQRASAGMGASGMRDYQTFIARLGEAVRQQDAVIEQLQADCARARARWLDAAARKSALGKVIATANSEEQQLEERRSQKEADEHAQRLGGAR